MSESKVYLEPIEHVYIHKETKKRYTSVTKVLSQFEPHFDSEGIANAIVKQSDKNKKEKYIGLNKEQILEHWQMLNDQANEYGTLVHNTLETYLLKKKWYFPEDEFEKRVISAYNTLKIDEGVRMYPERIMFSEEYELAGTSDLVIDIDDTFFDIADYKTNSKFNYYSPYNNMLLKPFDHLQDCQYSVYSLQLSIYALMYQIEHPNKKCRQIYILYWDKNEETFTRIPILYLKNEAKKLMEFHKYNLG